MFVRGSTALGSQLPHGRHQTIVFTKRLSLFFPTIFSFLLVASSTSFFAAQVCMWCNSNCIQMDSLILDGIKLFSHPSYSYKILLL